MLLQKNSDFIVVFQATYSINNKLDQLTDQLFYRISDQVPFGVKIRH